MAKNDAISDHAISLRGPTFDASIADSGCWMSTNNQHPRLMNPQIFAGTKEDPTINISTRPTLSSVTQNAGMEEAHAESYSQEGHSSPSSSSWAALSSPAISERSGTFSINGSRGQSPSDSNQSATPVSSQTLSQRTITAQGSATEGLEDALRYAPPPFPPPTYNGPMKGLSVTKLRDLIPTQPIDNNLDEKAVQPVSSSTGDGRPFCPDNSPNTSPESVLSKEEKAANHRHRIQFAFDRTLDEVLRASALIPLGLPDTPPSRFEVLDLACLYLAQLSEETIRLREDKALLSEMLARSNHEVTLLTRRASGITRPMNEMQVPQQEKKQAGDVARLQCMVNTTNKA